MPKEALNELMQVTGLPAAEAARVEFSGAEPYVPTQLKVGTAGAAAQAAIGIAAAELAKLRGVPAQQISVDVRDATYGLRSSKHTFLNDVPIGKLAPGDPWFNFYPVKNGWIHLHTNYPHHRDIMLATLGNPADYDAAAKASSTWEGIALEDAIHAAGGVAGFVRTPEEWAAHPQSQAVAQLPLLEIIRIGDAPPQPLPDGKRPLSGIRGLDLTRVLAGPTASRTLAEHGADILKINGPHLPNGGIGELDTGLGKMSALLDLREQAGVEKLRDLIREADVFSQGYRPGSLAARSFSPEELAKLRPGIVYVELSAWGRTGPWQKRRGFDTLLSAVNGWSYRQGKGGKPGYMPVSANDYVAGYLMALGVMTALWRRATEGGSWLVRTSLARTGRFIEDRGLLTPDDIASVPKDPPADEIAAISMETDSPAGKVRHLRPIVKLSETPAYWERPPVPLGYHQPEWPVRQPA